MLNYKLLLEKAYEGRENAYAPYFHLYLRM